MKISTKGRYALRLMLDLAQGDSDSFVSLKDIAQRQHISVKYMEQIVSQLTKAGLVESIRGPQGGYRLRKEPAQYKVGDILRVTEGKLCPVSCLNDTTNSCPLHTGCVARDFWAGYYEVIINYADGTTLQDLLNNKQAE